MAHKFIRRQVAFCLFVISQIFSCFREYISQQQTDMAKCNILSTRFIYSVSFCINWLFQFWKFAFDIKFQACNFLLIPHLKSKQRKKFTCVWYRAKKQKSKKKLYMHESKACVHFNNCRKCSLHSCEKLKWWKNSWLMYDLEDFGLQSEGI